MKNILYVTLILMACILFSIAITSPTIEEKENKHLIEKEYFIENNMKYLLINSKEIINITKDSLECEFYRISNLPENN